MKPLFIAEVSSNHHQDLDRCKAFIDAAAEIGCDAVKFQLFRIRELFAPEVLARSAEHRQREAWELDPALLAPLAAYAASRRLAFCCTPFYLDAVVELEPHVAFYKIASYELLWDDLLRAVAATGKPVILSTGMATLDEVRHAVDVLRQAQCRAITLLHCSSAYPTPTNEANLAAIETMRLEFGCPVGWSDHTRSPAVLARAIHRWNAATIEFHLDLDGEGPEYAAGHCWLPQEIAPVIRDARLALSADGDGTKTPRPSEQPDRDWRADPTDGLRPLRKIREQP